MAASASAPLPSAAVSFTSAPASSKRRAESTSPWRAANSSGVKPPASKCSAPAGLVVLRRPVPRNCRLTIVRAPTAAPCASSTRAASGWRWAAAHISAVCPFSGSVASTSAPCSISASTAAGSPVAAQRMSAVSPASSPPPASTPAASSRRTTSVLRLAQPTHSGVAPRSFAASTFAPAAISRSAVSRSFQCAAQCSAVAPSPWGVSASTPWSSRTPTATRSRCFAASTSRRSEPPAWPVRVPSRSARRARPSCAEPPAASPAVHAPHSSPAAASGTHHFLILMSIRHDSAARVSIQPFSWSAPAPGNAPGKLPPSKQGPLGLGSVCPRARENHRSGAGHRLRKARRLAAGGDAPGKPPLRSGSPPRAIRERIVAWHPGSIVASS